MRSLLEPQPRFGGAFSWGPLRPGHLHTLGDALRIHPALPGVAPPTARPSGSNWIHEIKHDGYRLMARRDPVGIRLITRRKKRLDDHFPLVVEAVNHLKVRSCLIDGEVVCCDAQGVTAFHLLRSGEGGVEAQRARARRARLIRGGPEMGYPLTRVRNPTSKPIRRHAVEAMGLPARAFFQAALTATLGICQPAPDGVRSDRRCRIWGPHGS
jgi:ATP dependent DNA ligase domain